MASGLKTRCDQPDHQHRTPTGAHACPERARAERMLADCPSATEAAGEVVDFWEPRDSLSFLAAWG